MTFFTVNDIRSHDTGHFFSPDTMSFWKTRICAGGRVFSGGYFVTSDTDFEGGRTYVVRRAVLGDDDRVEFDTYGRFENLDTAIRHAKKAGIDAS